MLEDMITIRRNEKPQKVVSKVVSQKDSKERTENGEPACCSLKFVM